MKQIKVLYIEPREAEYKEIKVFDNLDDYLKVYNDEIGRASCRERV